MKQSSADTLAHSSALRLAQALSSVIEDAQGQGAPVSVCPARYVLIHLAARITGYTVNAIERKIERGVWREGREWVRAPDGHLLIDLQGYEAWAVSATVRPARSQTAR